VARTDAALEPASPIIHERFGSNKVFEIDFGDQKAVTAAFSQAALVTKVELVNNRIAPSPMEPRATAAIYEPSDDRYTLWTSSQNPHLVRKWLAECSLQIPEHRVRVVSPDVGGGFGQKISHYPEEPLVVWAARLFGCPVRWRGTRSENLLEDTQARDHVTTCEMGFDADGRILGVRVDTVAALGGYASAFGASIPGYFYAPLLSGMYRIPAIYARVRGVYTNTVPTDAYRGAGRPEATYVVERLIEAGARQLGIDVAELRSRNFIKVGDFPYVSPTGMRYDSGNYPGLLEKILTASRYAELRAEQKRTAGSRQLLGIGFAAFVDTAGGSPSRLAARIGKRMAAWDSALIRVHPTGKITVFCGGHSHGQGHATTFAQIVAGRIGCSVEDVDIIEGDTDRVPFGHGTYASRSLSVIGIAISKATDKVIEKGRRIAAHLLECSSTDLKFTRGRYVIDGTDRAVDFNTIVHSAHNLHNYPADLEPGLEETAFYDPPGTNVPSSIHLCTVLVDRDTGVVCLRDYWSVDDVGLVINPMIVEGQVHGGLAQGIGQALFEGVVYDDTGQLITGSFMDYTMPRASDLPSFRTAFQETLSPDNPLGVKGAGECGTIGAPAAVVNAVIDALAPLGVRSLDMPLTPLRVWSAIKAVETAGTQAVGEHCAA
jgi:carbon-monoxide dehydrogenase large subunit